MRTEYKRLGSYALVLFTVLFVWSISLSSAQKMYHQNTSMELRYHQPTLTPSQLEKIQEEEQQHEKRLMTSMIGWEQIPQVTLENESLGKTAKSAMIYAFGNLRTLISRNQVTGEWVEEGDYKGALVSRKVAYDLWGSLDVIGKTFSYDKKEYSVRGVIEEDVPVVMIQVNPLDEGDMKFSQLRLQFIDAENIERKLELFRARYGLEETTTINLSLLSILLSQIVYLPMWMIGLYGVLKLLKLLYETYQYGVRALGIGIGAILVIGILFKLMTIKVQIPSYLIPNEWSDFEFWGNLFDALRANALEIQSLPKYLPDLWRGHGERMLIFTWGMSVIATIWGMRKLVVKESRQLFLHTFTAIIVSFLVILADYVLGIDASYPQAFWVMVPLVITIQYVTNKCGVFFKPLKD